MIVQIIGLPCSGKTTALKKWLKHKSKISYYDWADYDNLSDLFSNLNNDNSSKILLESACGLKIKKSTIVLYKQPYELIYQRHKLRNEHLDEDYLSLLESNSLIPNYTVSSEELLFNMLNVLFY